jgi:hypothetical protein
MAAVRRLIALVQPVISIRRSYQERVLALIPFAYWPMNETAGPTIADVTGSGYHGTPSANLTYAHAGPGAGNQAIYFDGDEWINLPAAFGTAFPGSCGPQGSMCIWAKADG